MNEYTIIANVWFVGATMQPKAVGAWLMFAMGLLFLVAGGMKS